MEHFHSDVLRSIFDAVKKEQHPFLRLVCKRFHDLLKLKDDKYAKEHVIVHCCTRGYLDQLKFIGDGVYPLKWMYVDFAAVFRQLHIIKWLYDGSIHGQRSCKVSGITHLAALQYGYLDLLEWLHQQQKIKESRSHTKFSALLGSEPNLCPWDETTCAIAAEYGHLHILKWLRLKDIHGDEICHWNENTCILAASNGHKHILKWLRSRKIAGDKSCPFHDSCYYSNIDG